ncbi:hypothetical protein [Heyndrickxia sporothermodurans]|nr:hypothetical protein [Heyndrickxia sporothermodurans]
MRRLQLKNNEGVQFMKVILELIRIILIFGFLGGVFSSVLNYTYKSLGVNCYEWTGFLAVLILLFVMYRNKSQFNGWYNGKGKEKLSRKVTKSLLSFSVFLLILPPFLSYLW